MLGGGGGVEKRGKKAVVRGKKAVVGFGGGHADFANNNALDFFTLQQRIAPSSIKRITS